MAFTTSDLSPAWANPVWSIPPSGTELAQGQPDRRRRRDLDAGDDRHEDEHGLLRHRLGDAALLPRVAARLGPAHGLADRRRPAHREAEVVAAADGAQRVVVRHRAAAARLRRQGRRQEAARRLGRDDGGRLVLLRRRDRAADLPARQGDRPHRASAAAAGQAGRRVPRLDRRAELLAGGVRPEDELHLQRRGRDGERDDPEEADADAEEAQAAARRRLPRAPERRLRPVPAGLARPRLDQRDRREHGPARLEVPDARAGARRRVDHRQRDRLRRRRRRQPARVRPQDRARCCGSSRPAARSRPARRSTRSPARSTSRSRSAARRRRRTAASCPG